MIPGSLELQNHKPHIEEEKADSCRCSVVRLAITSWCLHLRCHCQVRLLFSSRKAITTETGAGDGSCAFRRWGQPRAVDMGAYASLQPLFNQDLSSSSPTTTSPIHSYTLFLYFCEFSASWIGTSLTSYSSLLHRLSCCSIMPAKKRCQFQINTASQCSSAALRIVGECPHCRAQFCSSVSLLIFYCSESIID